MAKSSLFTFDTQTLAAGGGSYQSDWFELFDDVDEHTLFSYKVGNGWATAEIYTAATATDGDEIIDEIIYSNAVETKRRDPVHLDGAFWAFLKFTNYHPTESCTIRVRFVQTG